MWLLAASNTPNWNIQDVTLNLIILVMAVLLAAGIFAWFMTKAMLQAFLYPDPQPLAIALGLLTLIALIGALITGNTEAYTLCATGIGAIAGAVTANFTRRKTPGDKPPDQKENDEEEPDDQH